MAQQPNPSGPDLSAGVKLADFPDTGTIAGHVGEDPVLLSRFDGQFFAVSGKCTHYGAPLASGLLDGEDARCPWHHSCFSLRTGEPLRTPALAPLARYEAVVDGDMVFVRGKAAQSPSRRSLSGENLRVVIVGGGGAGLACANELRRLGHSGSIVILSADRDPPYDRPNLSKNYLAGSAPDAWMPLRGPDWYRDLEVELRLDTEVEKIDVSGRSVRSTAGDHVPFDRLLLATGCEPRRLDERGFDRENVLTLRSFADARAISRWAMPGARAAIIGSGFIAMEAAAALGTRGVDAEIVSPDHEPFVRVFGPEVGGFLRRLHADHGIRFHLGTVPASYDGQTVSLADQTSFKTDFVLLGVGVRPRTQLAEAAGLDVDNGVCVDAFLETSAPSIFAAGDIAAYPDPLTGERVRIEHWVVAERQGQAVAANMLGRRQRFDGIPFFWTMQQGVAVRSVGNSKGWDEVRIDGHVGKDGFMARYFAKDVHLASVSVGCDFESLEEEKRFEQRVAERSLAAHALND